MEVTVWGWAVGDGDVPGGWGEGGGDGWRRTRWLVEVVMETWGAEERGGTITSGPLSSASASLASRSAPVLSCCSAGSTAPSTSPGPGRTLQGGRGERERERERERVGDGDGNTTGYALYELLTLFWSQIPFCAILSLSGVLEPMKYSEYRSSWLAFAPGKINQGQKIFDYKTITYLPQV